MSRLGRRVTGDLGWNKRQRVFVGVGLALVSLHVCVIPIALAEDQPSTAVFEMCLVAFVLSAIFTGLPRARGADEPSAAKGIYRAGQPTPAIEQGVSHAFMEGVIVVFVVVHCVAMVLGVIAVIGLLLLLGLVMSACSHH